MRNAPIRNLTLLDVGTGLGTLLEVTKENNFSGLGLEPDRKFYLAAQKKTCLFFLKPSSTLL